jgi:hypothetical protein
MFHVSTYFIANITLNIKFCKLKGKNICVAKFKTIILQRTGYYLLSSEGVSSKYFLNSLDGYYNPAKQSMVVMNFRSVKGGVRVTSNVLSLPRRDQPRLHYNEA